MRSPPPSLDDPPHPPPSSPPADGRWPRSWDGYQGNLNEAELMKLAPEWAKLMLPSGYDTVTIDEFWCKCACLVSSASASKRSCAPDPNDGESASSLDAHGRAVVDESKWPSAKGGQG